MDPNKQKKRDKRLTNKEKSLERRKQRDRRDNHVRGIFSQASYEQKQEESKESEAATTVEEKKTTKSKN